MARWTDSELEDVRLPWAEFHFKHPARPYNAWEVKRRRVAKDAATGVPEEKRPVPGERQVKVGKRNIRIGLVSDTHGGSKFEQHSALKHFYQFAQTQGVEFFIHAGDVFQGSSRMHLGMELELHAHGAEAQVEYVAQTYPLASVPTYILGGNHDLSFHKDGGQNPLRQLADRRSDLIYLGQDAAYLSVDGLRAYVIHPDGAGAKTKARQLAESLPASRDVRLLLVGHFHNYMAFRYKDMFVLQLPCFQGQYSWMARRGLQPEIGGVILDLWVDESGSIVRISHEMVPYDEVLNDWDHEASALVNEAWTSEGVVI